MSSENTLRADNPEISSVSTESLGASKKHAKKEALKAEKLRRKQEEAAAAAVASVKLAEEDPLSKNYGDVPLEELQSKTVIGRKWTEVGMLDPKLAGETVLIRGFTQTIRAVGRKMSFMVVRQCMSTVQCVLTVTEELVSVQMVNFANSLSRESIVDVEGVIMVPSEPIKGTTQQAGVKLVRVNQDTRLNNRVLDLRTPANQAIFRLRSSVKNIFINFLLSEGFVDIDTPKSISGASEGGASVFKFDYNGQPACLAQSPQLHKQMAICAGLGRVFEIGSIYRAENSYTHRHLCEFVGLDAEMEIKHHYFEVLDIVDRLFVTMFDDLNEKCKNLLEAINKQFPFEPLKYLRKTLILTFEEGVKMLKDAGVEVDPFEDLNTEAERTLGRLVLEKYKTEFYILHRYPLAVRPFYTMPCPDNPLYSNSFDVFIRGEEIISGAQRIHVPDMLTSQAEARGIDVSTISAYIDSFRYGTYPHGGFGAGLERVVMLFCGLSNIRQTSMFPRDPKRLVP